MTEPDPAEDEIEDLVVATADEPLVLRRLADRGLTPEQTITSRDLGLTLLRGLAGMKRRGSELRSEHAEDIAALERIQERTLTGLDILLYDLRTFFAGAYAGWTPELGKNRWVDSVVTWPGGGRHDPMAVRNPVPVPAVAPLATGPVGAGVRIGMVDTAVYPHPRLAGRVNEDALIDVDAHGRVWRPWEGHGTLVADLVLSRAPSAGLTVRPVLGGEFGRARSWDIAVAIAGFVRTGIDILNVSLGCRTVDNQPPMVLAKAIDLLGGRVLVVAAAGNHARPPATPRPMWPAALPRVIAVGANDEPGAEFSPKVPWVRCTTTGIGVAGAYLDADVTLPPETDVAPVDAGGVVEPGLPRRPTPFDGFARWNGTSFAAAIVSGTVAAAMTPGTPPRETLDELLCRPGGVVRPHPHQP